MLLDLFFDCILLGSLGFDAKKASDQLGVASATKMCRSIMIKGLEAMVIESFTTARAYGVEDRRRRGRRVLGVEGQDQQPSRVGGGEFLQRLLLADHLQRRNDGLGRDQIGNRHAAFRG